MKRIALIIALALIISVGGVYATWVYSDLSVDARTHDFSAKLSVTGATSSTTKGVLSITDTLVLTVDDNEGNHIPGWDADVVGQEGNITVTFTPNTGASTTNFEYYITISNYTYDPGTGALNIFNPVDELPAVEGVQICAGTFQYVAGSSTPINQVINGADLQDALNLNSGTVSDPLVLESLAEYNAYNAAFGGVSLVLTVKEAA